MWNDVFAVLIGLAAGCTMSVSVSCVWCVLHLPARLQDRLSALSPHQSAWAICTGLLLSSLRMALNTRLMLPVWLGCLCFVPAGMFVGMLSSALGEILEAVPVLAHRLHMGDPCRAAKPLLVAAKGLGALLACLVVTN